MPMPTTVSTCTLETDCGKHVFEIFRYSDLENHMGKEGFLRSGSFSVGGVDWTLQFHTDVSIRLELLSHGAEVWASGDMSLVDQTTGLPSLVQKMSETMFVDKFRHNRCHGPLIYMFNRLDEFQKSAYLRDYHLTVVCSVTVKKHRVSTTQFLNQVEAPPSSITEQLRNMLDSEYGADLTFSVGGETFKAHKAMLAARSAVFKAELYGPMIEAREQHVTIEDVQPAVFKALLHFIYTDSLPDMDHLGGGGSNEMIGHLLVAADIYAVERLKSVCESILCKNLDVESVSTTLALAHQHNCDKLKEFCLQFTSSPNVMDAVVATRGYKNLKTTWPLQLTEIFEKSVRL